MIINYVINKLVSLDPEVQIYQQALTDKVVRISCSDFPNKPLYLSFADSYIQITLTAPNHIDIEISGSLLSLISLNQAELRITGNLSTAQALQSLVLKLNIDWEEELSKYTGDVIAHQTVYRLKQLRRYQQQTSSSLEAMITEYLQEESGLLPTKYEIDEFMQAVDDLRLDTDRLSARIKAYEHN